MKTKKFFSAGTLKIAAIITMLIDHIGAGLFYPLKLYEIFSFSGIEIEADVIYNVLRNIGRFAFPVFAFMLVEGFYHTKSRWKYGRNLLLFALISEIPFDLLFSNQVTWEGQNVMFTFFIALGVIWIMDSLKERCKAHFMLRLVADILVTLTGCVAATWLQTDYSYYGVILVVIFYALRDYRFFALLTGYLWFLFEPWCLPAFIALYFYNGKRGIKLKYFFYVFYPLHLMVLYLIRFLQ